MYVRLGMWHSTQEAPAVPGSWWWLSTMGALPLMALVFAAKVRWARARSPEFHPTLPAPGSDRASEHRSRTRDPARQP